MILEGFEIQNWSCIKRVCIGNLPPTGVIVLHGPNGTGKSSIIEALRACLMDNKSTSRAIDRGFPKNSTEKPRVSVTFRADGTSWRITKQFGSKESKLESRTAAGQWKLETADPSEAHDRARQLAGGSDSTLGLHQLLWLTQAEFRLPEPKKFAGDVQSRLRAVLGVLQTPLDDCFLGRVKEGWSRWFGARSKPGEMPKLKKGCPLDKALTALQQHKAELAAIEADYQRFEQMMERSSCLEVLSQDLRRQLEEKTRAYEVLQQEHEKSRTLLEAHQHATERLTRAEAALAAALATKQRRAEVEKNIRDAARFAEIACEEAEEKNRQLQRAEQRLRTLRLAVRGHESKRRELQTRLNEVNNRRQLLSLKEQWNATREKVQRAEQLARELEELQRLAREHPAPSPATMKSLEQNRARATKLRADLDAAAITLVLIPDAGAVAPRVAIDGGPAETAEVPDGGTTIERSIRRRAEIAIPGWGTAELTRGSDTRSLEQLEAELADLDRCFGKEIAPFGVVADDPASLDRLHGLVAACNARRPEHQRKQSDLNREAPRGLEPLRQELARLEKTALANESVTRSPTTLTQMSDDVALLERLQTRLNDDIEASENAIVAAQRQIEAVERVMDGVPGSNVPGLREQDAEAKQRLTTFKATAEVARGELKRLLTPEQVECSVREAEQAVCEARDSVDSVKLSEDDETIRERLEAAAEGLRVLRARLTEVDIEFHQIKGAISVTEGMHQRRAAIAARVEGLTRQTNREALESEAYDRLYALFEECREKQLGTLMGPIHDRVLRWMRLLRISSYQSIRFNDQMLPDKLVSGDGAVELTLDEESTGTIEQVGLMVRLALGATLSAPDNPVVAILDDPLTHSDVVRLDRMRAVLKSAATGDPDSIPPAGPLQVVVFTCHPEWFAIDDAKMIDLSKDMH